MYDHNAKIQSLASVALTPEQTIGASLNWKLPSSMQIHEATMKAALLRHGLPETIMGDPTSPLARFRNLNREGRVCHRRRDEHEIVATPVRHDESTRHLVSFCYSVNLDAPGTERGILRQIGSLTFDTSNGSYWWRYEVGPRRQSETIDEYTDRALAAHNISMKPARSDLEAFAKHAIALLDDVCRFETPSHCGDYIRHSVSVYLRRIGGYLMSQRGGFWYLPRTGQNHCPFTQSEKLISALEEASVGEAKFYRLTMPKDSSSIDTAGEIVRESLSDRISELLQSVTEMGEITRRGQHAGRLEEISELRSRIAIYRDMLGILDSDLLSGADEVERLLNQQIEAHEKAAATKVPTRPEVAATATGEVPIKRGPGRPRKHPLPEAAAESGQATVKRGPGRPRKHPLPEVAVTAPGETPVKRGPGRPRKYPLPEVAATAPVEAAPDAEPAPHQTVENGPRSAGKAKRVGKARRTPPPASSAVLAALHASRDEIEAGETVTITIEGVSFLVEQDVAFGYLWRSGRETGAADTLEAVADAICNLS